MMMFRISSPLIWTPSLATQTGILVSKSVWKKWYIHCQYSFYYRLGPLLESIIKQLVENSFKSEITFFPIASTWNFIKKPEVLQTFAATYFIKETVSKSVSQFKKKKKIQLLIWQIYTQQHHHQKIISLYHHLKELQNHILCIICELSFFFHYKSAFSTFCFAKLVFCLSVFSVFHKFWIDVILI